MTHLDARTVSVLLGVALAALVAALVGALLFYRRLAAQLRTQKQLFENLVAVARATSASPALGETLRNTLEVACSLTGADGASLFLLDGDGRVTNALVLPTEDSHLVAGGGHAVAMDRGLAGWVARERKPALVEDTRVDARWVPLATIFEPRSVLSVPVSSGGTLAGILTLVHRQPRHFAEGHLSFIQAAGDQLGLALRNAQIFDAHARQASRQATLYQVLQAMENRLDPASAADTAARAIADRTAWPNVVVALPDEDAGLWRFHTAARAPLLRTSIPLAAGIIGRAYSTGTTQLVPDVTQDPSYVPGLAEIRSELAVPLRHGERRLGVLNVESDRTGAFGPDDVQLAESVADALGLALDNAELFRRERTAREQSERLEATARALSSTLEPETVAEIVIEALGTVVPSEVAMVQEWRDGKLVVLAARGTSAPSVGDTLDPDAGDGRWREALEGRRTVLREDAEPEDGQAAARRGLAASWMGVPLVHGEHVVGLFTFNASRRGLYTAARCAAAEGFASPAAIAMENARLFETVRDEIKTRTDAQQALQRSEAAYRDLFQRGLGLLCTHDLDGVLLSLNPAAADALGRTVRSMVGRNLREFLSERGAAAFDDYLHAVAAAGSVFGRDGDPLLGRRRTSLAVSQRAASPRGR